MDFSRLTKSLERMRAGQVVPQFGSLGLPASLSSGVRLEQDVLSVCQNLR